MRLWMFRACLLACDRGVRDKADRLASIRAGEWVEDPLGHRICIAAFSRSPFGYL
jgi:hypothetical protein